jgi:hypothetical protein
MITFDQPNRKFTKVTYLLTNKLSSDALDDHQIPEGLREPEHEIPITFDCSVCGRGLCPINYPNVLKSNISMSF